MRAFIYLILLSNIILSEVRCYTFNLLIQDTITNGPDANGTYYIWADGSPTNNVSPQPLLKVISVMFDLAVKHFNERRYDLIPLLGNLSSCTAQLQAHHCDSYCSAGAGLRNYLEVEAQTESKIDGVVGLVCSDEAGPFAIAVDALYGIPSISTWATAPKLSDKTQYPKLARTIASDGASAYILAKLLKQLNVGKVGALYISNSFGGGYKDSLTEALQEQEILTYSYAFQDAVVSNVTLIAAIKNVIRTRVNILLFIGSNDQVSVFTNVVSFFPELLSSDKLWIYPVLDGQYAPLLDFTPQQQAVMNGALHMLVTPDTTLWTRFTQAWDAGNFSTFETIDFIDDLLPKSGNANQSGSCMHSNLDFEVNNVDFFQQNEQIRGDIQLGIVYDAVIAMGVAACLANSTHLPTSDQLWAQILNLNFEGISGMVKILPNGDRDRSSFSYVMLNWRFNSETQQFESQPIARWVAGESSWNLSQLSLARFRSGSNQLPPDTTFPPVDQNHLAYGLRVVAYVELCIVCFCCLVCLVWLRININSPIVRMAQGPVLYLIILGVFIAAFSLLAITSNDSPEDSFLDENVSCTAAPVLFVVGFQISSLAFLLKIWKVHLLFHNSNLKQTCFRRITPRRMLLIIMAVLLVESIAFAGWFALDPLLWVRHNVYLDDGSETGLVVTSHGSCVTKGELGFVLFGFIAAQHLVLLVLTAVGASYVKDVKQEFQEGGWMNVSTMINLQLALIGIPTIAASYNSENGKFIVISTMVFINCLSVLFCMFVPKMFYGRWIFATEQSAVENDSNKRQHQQERPVVSSTNIVPNYLHRVVNRGNFFLSNAQVDQPKLESVGMVNNELATRDSAL